MAPFAMDTAKNMGLWALQIAGAYVFLTSGLAKLTSDEQMVGLFTAIGVGQWFRYVTGSIELLSGLLLITPWFSAVGALFLSVTMLGAILTHLFVVGGSPLMAIAMFVAMSLVLWGRREQLNDLNISRKATST